LRCENPRPPKRPRADAARQPRKRTERVHGINVSQQQPGLAAVASRKVDLQVIAELGRAMKLAVPAECLELAGKPAPKFVDRCLSVTRRLDFDHLADRFNDCVLPLLKVREPRRDPDWGLFTCRG